METDNLIHPPKEESLEEKFARERIEWSQKVSDMSAKMKNIYEIPELMTYLYTERQRAAEYYHYLVSLMIKLNKKYNAEYAIKQDYYTNKVQVRYPNESVKHNRILVDLGDLFEKRAMIDNHSKYINQTITSIDAIIYAISRRVEIENLARGK